MNVAVAAFDVKQEAFAPASEAVPHQSGSLLPTASGSSSSATS